MLGRRRGALLLFVGLVGAGFAARAPAQVPVPTGPNFVIVMSDDQAPAMMKALPTVTRELGGGGTTFTNAFASYPLCCPARATLLTGEYAHNHGTKGNNPLSGGGYRALLEPDRTLASWLQANGYQTGFVGKWLNGLRTPRRAPPGWNEWDGLVGEGGEGLSSFYDYDVFEPDGGLRHFGDRPADYQTDALTREYALPFIDAQAAVPGPFFLWLAYHPPHNGVGRNDPAGHRCSEGPPASRKGRQSAIPPPRYARAYSTARVPHPPSFDERDVSDKPKFVRRRPRLRREDLTQITRDYRCGLASLRALDDSVQRILEHLGSTAQLSNTVLVFLTDQGVMAGEHRIKRGKNRPYEEAIRIPLLMRGPGIAAGQTIDAPVSNADLAPTMLQLAGATIPPELARPIDGQSQTTSLATGQENPRRVVPIEGPGQRRRLAPRLQGPVLRRGAHGSLRVLRVQARSLRHSPRGDRRPDRCRPDDRARALRPGQGPLRTAQPRPRSGLRGDPQPALGSDRRARALLGPGVRRLGRRPRPAGPRALA